MTRFRRLLRLLDRGHFIRAGNFKNGDAQNDGRGNLTLMSQISVADILELPVQERIQLVEVIWESIAAVPHAVEVSPELKVELGARLADFERNPEAGYSWDQVKEHLKSGSWRTV